MFGYAPVLQSNNKHVTILSNFAQLAMTFNNKLEYYS